ncbi:MAG: EamA family transporter, partial [Clostridia bacterium]|nr:EamA family transporter [Clostridia bacterium]
MDKKTKGMLLVVAAAFFIGTEAIFAKLVYGAGVNVITTITLRFTLASLIVLPILIITGHSLRIPPGRRGMMLGLILAYIIVAALLFQAFALLPASLAIMLLYAYPSLTA